MPVSIPTYLALRFVTRQPLKKRIKVLQKSYQYQVAGISIFSVINFDKIIFTKKIASMTPILL